MFDIAEELKKLPDHPGVYLMHDKTDEIIYIGKAVSLKNRVRQYFQSSRNKSSKIEKMVAHIARFEYILTDSELEALVLECNLIKEHRPRYNTMLKDDKAYPYIQVTVKEDFPRIRFSRRMKKDDSRYFGPFSSAGAVKDTIELLNRLYQLRSCSRVLPRDTGKERACLNYHIRQCSAPCQNLISKEDYRLRVEQALDFLNGNYRPVIGQLAAQMKEASDALAFERAAEIKELLDSVRAVAQKQKMSGTSDQDKDVIALATEENDAIVSVFFVREGKLIGREHFPLRIGNEDTMQGILSAFIRQYYAGTPHIPHEILLSEMPEDETLIGNWLSEKSGHRVHVRVPKKGKMRQLLILAQNNASLTLSQDRERIRREEGRTIGAVKELAALLGIEPPQRMEAFDISNTSGFDAVGSMVVYDKGKPKRSDYRKFRIKTVAGPDDYASMEEVLERRLVHGLKERESLAGQEEAAGRFVRFPDLILMDGGKGQVGIAQKVLDRLELPIPVCGMVKDDRHKTRGLYYNGREVPIQKDTEAFRLITRIQEEAHRFAIGYHRSLRSKEQVHSVLDDIPGIGQSRRRALMKTFVTLDAIRSADVETLAAVPAMNRASAKAVYTFFHPEEDTG